MIDTQKVADEADMIVDGYAFTKEGNYIRVLNLNRPGKAAVILNGEIIETTMDGIEMSIVTDYYRDNKEFMEE